MKVGKFYILRRDHGLFQNREYQFQVQNHIYEWVPETECMAESEINK